jgi:hypothetical protein
LPRQIGPGFLKSKIKDYHMWVTIDKETYMQKVAGLDPIESITDPDGTLYQSSEGKPRAVTVWGHKAKGDQYATPVVKCEMKKEHRHVIEWDAQFFEWVVSAMDNFSTN